VNATAAAAPSAVKRRNLLISTIPTGSVRVWRLPELAVRSPVVSLLTVVAYGFPQGIG
jgi:hypothetical protein